MYRLTCTYVCALLAQACTACSFHPYQVTDKAIIASCS